MNPQLYYLLQVLVTSGIFYGYYRFALHDKKFHQYNSFYLVAAILISILIPILDIPVYFSVKENDSSYVFRTLEVLSSITVSSGPSSWVTIENIFYSVYFLAVLIAFIRIIFSLLKIRNIITNNQVEIIDQIKFVKTEEPGTPFSFFHWLFWNRKLELNSEKGQQIFRHELFHIQQKHSWEILFMEIITAIFWINPFFHLIKKELKTIHEFLADEFAASENDKWRYAELLLMQVMNTENQLVNPFFNNQIKRRITMLTSSSKPSYLYLRKLMAIPITALVIGLFACNYSSNKRDSDITSKADKATNKTEKFIPPVIIKDEDQLDSIKYNIPKVDLSKFTPPRIIKDEDLVDNKIFSKLEVQPSFPGGEVAWRKYLERNLNPNIPVDAGAPEGQYTVMVQFIVDKKGTISDLKALTNHGYGMEEALINLIEKGPKWSPGLQNDHAVSSYRIQPITFVVSSDF